MYTNYNIPQNKPYHPNNFHKNPPTMRPIYHGDDRFLGGGFLGPFLLGGVGGYLLGRPNYNGPIPVFFPPGTPYGMPFTQNFYY